MQETLVQIPGLGRSPGEGNDFPLQYSWAFLVAQMVKNLPAMQETWVWSLGWEDPLEEGLTTHISILAWRIPWTKGAWKTAVHGVTVRHDWADFHFHFLFICNILLDFPYKWYHMIFVFVWLTLLSMIISRSTCFSANGHYFTFHGWGIFCCKHVPHLYFSVNGHLGCFHVFTWRRQWQPTPVLLPGKSLRWRSLVGLSPWGR